MGPTVLERSVLQASVHIQHLTSGPGCVIAAQVCDGAGDVIQLSQSRDADTRRELIHLILRERGTFSPSAAQALRCSR